MSKRGNNGWSLQPMGDRCLIIEFESRVAPEVNGRVRSVAEHLLSHPIEGVVDIVPAFTTVAVHYRPEAVRDGPPSESPYRRLCRSIERILAQGIARTDVGARVVEVPVCYGGEFGPDLAHVAAFAKMTEPEVIALHSANIHRVFMLGFVAGFAYMGIVDARIAIPRHATPRVRVPLGSVGIAGVQTGVYPAETPGGWQLIGRTPVKPFDASRAEPFLMKAGDRVQFTPIDRTDYDRLS